MSIFESQESIKKRAAETVNNAFDPKFLEKYEKIKPQLDEMEKTGAYEKSRQKVEAQKKADKEKMDKIRGELGIAHLSAEDVLAMQRGEKEYVPAPGVAEQPIGEPAPISKPGSQPRATWEIERDMFKPENIKARAQNRIDVMKNSKDYKPENIHWSEKAKNILKNLDSWKGFGK